MSPPRERGVPTKPRGGFYKAIAASSRGFTAMLGHASCCLESQEESTMYPYGISVGGIILLIVLVMLLTGRL